jgi:cell wall-associated NlpC family hydrolase
MAKKKAASKKKASSRPAAAKKATKKAGSKKAAAKKAAAKKKTAAKKTATKSAAPKKKTARKASASEAKLGRARITGDAKLDEFFKRDYEARQVFEFLRVHTLKELEQYGPQEIVERLTGPMVRTIDRIRKALALNNRSLKGDERYAVEFLSAIGGTPRTRKVTTPSD